MFGAAWDWQQWTWLLWVKQSNIQELLYYKEVNPWYTQADCSLRPSNDWDGRACDRILTREIQPIQLRVQLEKARGPQAARIYPQEVSYLCKKGPSRHAEETSEIVTKSMARTSTSRLQEIQRATETNKICKPSKLSSGVAGQTMAV